MENTENKLTNDVIEDTFNEMMETNLMTKEDVNVNLLDLDYFHNNDDNGKEEFNDELGESNETINTDANEYSNENNGDERRNNVTDSQPANELTEIKENEEHPPKSDVVNTIVYETVEPPQLQLPRFRLPQLNCESVTIFGQTYNIQDRRVLGVVGGLTLLLLATGGYIVLC